MAQLIFHPQAKLELREALAYYEDKRPGLGEQFLTAVRSTTGQMRANPARCSFISPAYRCCRLKRFPFGVVYRVDEDLDEEIFIVAIMHLKRKPGYWRSRSRGDVRSA